MAADRPACARLLAVAPAGRSAASYTITRDTTNARGWFARFYAQRFGFFEQAPCLRKLDEAIVEIQVRRLNGPTVVFAQS